MPELSIHICNHTLLKKVSVVQTDRDTEPNMAEIHP
jgi:hypothetical protein